MWKVREIADKVTNVVMNYTEIESKVREATNDDPWGPTGTIKHELSQATYSYDQFPEVMGMLWKRIAENKRSPRRIYKSLLLLHHLLLHGSDRVVRAAQDRLYELRGLQDYHVIYEPGFNLDAIIPPSGTETKDGELNVRVKAKDMVDLIGDEDRLRDERKKARKNRDKYVGIGSDRMMTSKWTDNDFSGGGGYDDEYAKKSSGYDDEYGKKSRSPSPSLKSNSKFKPFSDTEDFKKSPSSNSFNNNHTNSTRTKPAPPSPGLEITDDFDPRAEEKSTSDFGDFTSAAVKSTASPSFGAPKRPSGDFADFQSAFGGETAASSSSIIDLKSAEPPQHSTIASSNKAEDLLGLSLDLGGGISNQPSNNNASLLSDNLFSSSTTSQQQQQQAPGFFPAFGQSPPAMPSPTSLGGMGGQFPAAFPPVAAVSVGGGFSPPIMGGSMAQPSQQEPGHVMNFGGNNLLSPILEPAKNSGNVPNNSSSSNNNNNSKQSLQGTTWSDLNISIDDLNLGRSNSRTTGTKTPMNQLKANTPANIGGLL